MSPLRTLRSSALLGLLVLAGCNQILDIDVQDKVDPKGDASQNDAGQDAGEEDAEIVFESPSEDDCADYCGAVKMSCSAMSKAAFANETYCTGLCPHMQRRPDKSTANANTFDCRLKLVNSVAGLGGDDTDECKSVGAGGNTMCGSNCQGYCQLYESVCGKFPGLSRGDTCVSECEKLPTDATRDAASAFSSASDTLQCRLAHLGAASTSDEAAIPHCKHSAISVTTEYTPCLTDTPRCEDFCTLQMNTCKGKLQQYETFMDCVAVCKNGLTLKTTLGPGEPIDINHDTVACRRYHAYNALKTPDGVHCEHTGPTGDGHCGKICPAYCQLAKAACGTDYDLKYTNVDACLSDCRTGLANEGVMDEIDHHYALPKGKASDAAPMQCRVYHLSKAFLAKSECASALGGGDCKAN